MSNQIVATLLRNYARQFRRDLKLIQDELPDEFCVERDSKIALVGKVREYPILKELNDTLEAMECDITDLECADD